MSNSSCLSRKIEKLIKIYMIKQKFICKIKINFGVYINACIPNFDVLPRHDAENESNIN